MRKKASLPTRVATTIMDEANTWVIAGLDRWETFYGDSNPFWLGSNGPVTTKTMFSSLFNEMRESFCLHLKKTERIRN